MKRVKQPCITAKYLSFAHIFLAQVVQRAAAAAAATAAMVIPPAALPRTEDDITGAFDFLDDVEDLCTCTARGVL